MKKLLVLMLVLGMASMVNAALLQLSIDGEIDGTENVTEITIAPSDTILVDVQSTDGLPDNYWLGITSLGGSGEWLGSNLYAPPAPSTHVVTDGGYGADWFKVAMSSPVTDSEIGTWFDAIFHCTGEGDVSIDLYDASGNTVIDTILVHQTPEPMTIALLGLGGLLLRRRKA